GEAPDVSISTRDETLLDISGRRRAAPGQRSEPRVPGFQAIIVWMGTDSQHDQTRRPQGSGDAKKRLVDDAVGQERQRHPRYVVGGVVFEIEYILPAVPDPFGDVALRGGESGSSDLQRSLRDVDACHFSLRRGRSEGRGDRADSGAYVENPRRLFGPQKAVGRTDL